MKKLFVCAALTLLVGIMANAQENRVDITSFEDGLDWKYNSGTNLWSGVEELPAEIGPIDGPNALYVEYDSVGAAWQWAQIDFLNGALDLRGMREIHMSVYFLPGAEGETSIRIDLPGGIGLGKQTAPTTGEWHDLVWKIDRLTSEKLESVANLGGFLVPTGEGGSGELYIDNIYAVRPAGVPDVETQLLYGFNEEDPSTGTPLGWTNDAGVALLGEGEVTPSEGSNYASIELGAGWTQQIKVTDPKGDFDRWTDLVDFMIDARVSEDFTGTWCQYVLVFQTGGGGTDVWDQLPEQAIESAKTEWKTLVWQVDMSKHQAHLEAEDGWINLVLITNNDAAVAGQIVYLDNFRVGVAKDTTTPVSTWSLF